MFLQWREAFMKREWRKWLYLLIGLILILGISFVFGISKVKLDASNYLELGDNWHIEINDQVYEDVALHDFIFPSTSKGDVIKMSCSIPGNKTINNPILRLYFIHSVVEVKYNDTIYYEYGKELKKENKLLGYGYHYVHIPTDYQNGKLEVILQVTEDDAFSSLTPPEICNNDVVQRDFIIQNRIPFAINIFLIVFGILLLLVSLIFCMKYKQFMKLICVGGFSVGIGLWSLCNYDLTMMFTYNLQLKTYMEYASFYIAPIFVWLYFWGDTFLTRYKVVNIAYRILVVIQIIFTITAFFLQLTGILHFPAMLRIQHCILLVTCIGVILLTIHDLIKKQLSNRFLILGMTAMLVIGLCDIIHFIVVKYWTISEDVHYTSIICIGTMIFVLSQLAEFGAGITNILLQGARAELLEQMAYVDEMTGLVNRRRCEEIWDSLDDEQTNYGIFSFDLNFLKKVNDTKGHAKGDVLIKMMAQVLQNVFDSVGEVGRIGGDEYVVFIRDMKGIDIQELIMRLKEELKQTNLENPEMNLSASYGFCSHEQYPDLDSRHIYRKADALMYEMKASMKAVRKD